MLTLVGLHQGRIHRHFNGDRYGVPFQRWQSAVDQRFQCRPVVYSFAQPQAEFIQLTREDSKEPFSGRDTGYFGLETQNR